MQLAALFAVTFVISRILVRIEAHLDLLRTVVHASQGSPQRLCAGVMGATFVLSMFIPNLITVVVLLPIVSYITEHLEIGEEARRGYVTVLALGVMYGANIGGMASIVGTPANALAVIVVHEMELAQLDQLTFFNWLLFGFPMALVLLIAAWGVLVVVQRSACRVSLAGLRAPLVNRDRDYTFALSWAALILAGCALFGVVGAHVPHGEPLFASFTPIDLATLFGMLGCFAVVGWLQFPVRGERLIRLADLRSGLPKRGVVFAGAAIVCGLALERLGAIRWLTESLQAGLPEVDPTMALWALVVVTIFATELLSNTATALAMWAVAAALAELGGYDPFLSIVGVALASTCAFMSPLATPAIGMAFGGIQGVSLRQMVVTGFFVNVIAAVWIVVCLNLWIPRVLAI